MTPDEFVTRVVGYMATPLYRKKGEAYKSGFQDMLHLALELGADEDENEVATQWARLKETGWVK